MQSGRIVRIFVASPTDTDDLCTHTEQVIAIWNAKNSYHREIIIEQVRAETHATAAQGNHPQNIISGQLINRCDILVGIFRHKIGTPTPSSQSGTVQEIEDFCKEHAEGRVMLFFSNELVKPEKIDEYKVLAKYRESMNSKGYYKEFANADEFRTKFRDQLDLKMNEIAGELDSPSASIDDRDAEWVNTSYGTVIRRGSGREWVEEEAKGVIRFKLVEVARGDGYVDLYNEAKNELWRISETTMFGRQITCDPKWLANGKWRKSK